MLAHIGRNMQQDVQLKETKLIELTSLQKGNSGLEGLDNGKQNGE